MKHVVRKIRKLNRWDWLFIVCMTVIPMICIVTMVRIVALTNEIDKAVQVIKEQQSGR